MNTCPDCGVLHDWRNCPEFEESVFYGEDPEWVEAEVEDLMADYVALDHLAKRGYLGVQMRNRLGELEAAVIRT